jgi:hypothetical protein
VSEIDLGIYEPTSTQSKKNASIFSNKNNDMLTRIINQQMATFDGSEFSNFNSIVSKYPFLSKEVVIGLVKAGANADTPGIDKVTSLDGVQQAIRAATMVKDLPSLAAKDKNLLSTIKDNAYGVLKGTVRVGFATARSPYDYTTTVFRDVYGAIQGEEGSAGRIIQNLNPTQLVGKTTQLGALLRDVADGGGISTGSGFFLDPNSRVGKNQAKAMQAFGRVNGKSFTIGRGSLSTIGVDPNSDFYKTASGVIDAVINVAADPLTYLSFGTGALAKGGVALKGGKKLAEVKAVAVAEQKLADDVTRAKSILDPTNDEKLLMKARETELGTIRRDIKNTYMSRDSEFIQAERSYKEALKFQNESYYASVVEATSKELPELADPQIARFLGDTIIAGKQDDTIRQLSQLSGDFSNIGKAFPGAFLLDELPEAGKISVAAQGLEEFVVSAAKSDLKIVDLATDYSTMLKADVAEEVTRRASLFDEIENLKNNPEIPLKTREALKSLDVQAFIDDLMFNGGSAENLATILGKVALTKDEYAMALATDAIKKIWQADGFSNVRAIYGRTGGIAITSLDALAAKSVTISNLLADSRVPGVVLDVPTAIRSAEQAVERARVARDAALRDVDTLDAKAAEIAAIREYVERDPDLLKEIINNPEYGRLGTLMDLEVEIGRNRYYQELLSAESGLIERIGGPISENIGKVNEFLLGKRFAIVAEIVAKETSAARISRLFNNKLDMDIVKLLTDAKTPDEVLAILRRQLASPVGDPRIARSLALRGQALAEGNIPVIKSIMPPNGKALMMVEKMETFLTRQYSRSKVLPLNDLDRLTKGVAEWMGTALMTGVRAGSPAAKAAQDLIDDTINKLVAATSESGNSINAARAKIIDDAIRAAQNNMVDTLAPGSKELKEILSRELVLSGEQMVLYRTYANTLLPDGQHVGVMIGNGEEATLDGAVYLHQFVDDVIRLPDTKPIYRAIAKYDKLKRSVGGGSAAAQFITEFGEHWRTAQLAFRISYVTRNVGEMQFRMFLSGHETLLSHPLGFAAMMYADQSGNAMQKLLKHFEKYGDDMLGNSFKDPQAAKLLTDAMDEYLTFMGRKVSAGDMRSLDAKTRLLGKWYRVVDYADENFYPAFATTLARFNLDDMMPLVARADTPQLQAKLVDDLINNRPIMINGQERTNLLKEILEASFSKNERGTGGSDFARVFLKDPEAPFSKANLNADGIRNWLFDPNSTGSYETALKGLMGSGERGLYIRRLLADGVVKVPTATGDEIIRMPRFKNSASIEEGRAAEKAFKEQLERLFPRDEMTDAVAIFSDTKAWMSANPSILKNAVDWFFTQSAKVENIAAYGPEFRMSYWDHIGRYAPAMGLDDLLRLQKQAGKTLSGITMRTPSGKRIPVGKRHEALRVINKEIRKRQKNPNIPQLMSYDDVHVTAARMAGEYTRDLFYDASRQLDSANKLRLLFPFIQAHFNTIKAWTKLTLQNPRQIYKFGKAYNALLQPGSSAIYDLTNTKYEEGQGFFYKDDFGKQRFRYPMAGDLFSAFVGMGIGDTGAKDALQLTAPVQSLNLAFGSVNPGMPGLGPVAQIAYMTSGKSHAFGPQWDFMRDIIFPFGEPGASGTGAISGLVLPAWLNKSFLLFINDSTMVERETKDWAGYLASTGKYGDNPFANDTARNELFNDAQHMGRWTSLLGAFFQSIAPATPSTEIFTKIKTDEGKFNFISSTQLYKNWDEISKANPGNYEEARKQFADRFGWQNLLVVISGSTKSVTGTEDAWAFLNNHPNAAVKYATRDADIVPYFFPGGEAAMSYYQWQLATSRREKLSREELEAAAEDLVYNMELSQISEEQAANGYSDIWYTKKVVELNKLYSGKPASTIITGRQEKRATAIGEALKDPAFKDSPVYAEASEFYDSYLEKITTLQNDRNTPTPDLGSSFWLNTKYREELERLGTDLMMRNPAFSRMYYSVFANLLKKSGE